MSEKEILNQLEEIMDLNEDTLAPETVLADLEEWDSLSKLTLISSAKTIFHKELNAAALAGFNTVNDIISFLN